MNKKRYAQVGTGGRARMYYEAIAETFNETSELVAFCDINQTRMDYANNVLEGEFGYHKVPTYKADEFEKMILETKPDYVIVTTVDRTHHRYIIKAMEMGCDVISEKPMTVDEVKCQEIIDCIERTGKNLRVTFNYRYAPHNTKIRDLIMKGTIGKVTQVHFEWFLNTSHGADYFRRWHRDKRNSGGLLVHKSTHHFDLVNFWLDTYPTKVFALGGLKFYGRENAEERGVTKFYNRGTDNPIAKDDPFALDLRDGGNLEGLYYNAEHEDGYIRDQSVFGDYISIEDTMNVVVQYASGAQLSYSLNAYSAREGFRVTFTGTNGRIELDVAEEVYINAGGDADKEGCLKHKSIVVQNLFGQRYDVEIEEGDGGHGGGDKVLLNDIFGTPDEDPYKRAAGYEDGAMSILTGIAGNKSIASGMPINVLSLVDLPKFRKK
ncbi:MAG: Gfo/Idh/MocA family oxidoreductase [Clostridia bacterium]|nr:Gfo/Idh/MocA family oxidoreductase [Clostridia bacterium]